MPLGGSNSISRSIAGLSEGDKVKLKGAITEIDGAMTRIAGEKDLIKNAIADAAEELDLSKKLIRKLAATYHKADFQSEKDAFHEFEEFYDAIQGVIAKP